MERTDAETMFDITKEAFIEYLNKLPDEPFCHSGNCPLKQFYVDTDGLRDIHVSTSYIHTMDQVNPGDDVFELPQWAKYFVHKIDERDRISRWRNVTPKKCLRILEDV